ncbi:MAG TPA: hypothetical protein VKQ28_10290 [Candidatus Acidoferrum sp.]|nr:hypothetical protein [Candidatus Acidoferrum sp.]
MTRDEQLQRYYRDRVERGLQVLAQTPAADRKRVDFENGYWHERVILQRLLENGGLPSVTERWTVSNRRPRPA